MKFLVPLTASFDQKASAFLCANTIFLFPSSHCRHLSQTTKVASAQRRVIPQHAAGLSYIQVFPANTPTLPKLYCCLRPLLVLLEAISYFALSLRNSQYSKKRHSTSSVRSDKLFLPANITSLLSLPERMIETRRREHVDMQTQINSSLCARKHTPRLSITKLSFVMCREDKYLYAQNYFCFWQGCVFAIW